MAIKTWHKGVAVILGAAGAWLMGTALPATAADVNANTKIPAKSAAFTAAKGNAHYRRGQEWKRQRYEEKRREQRRREEWKRRNDHHEKRRDDRHRNEHRRRGGGENRNGNKWRHDRGRWNRGR